jgi:hypothetical protein
LPAILRLIGNPNSTFVIGSLLPHNAIIEHTKTTGKDSETGLEQEGLQISIGITDPLKKLKSLFIH